MSGKTFGRWAVRLAYATGYGSEPANAPDGLKVMFLALAGLLMLSIANMLGCDPDVMTDEELQQRD